MAEKQCISCGIGFEGKFKSCYSCLQIHRVYCKNWYRNNGGKAWYERRNKRGLEYMRKAKDTPCMDCGQSFPPYVMQFDHVRGKKRFELSKAHRYCSKTVDAEIAKCDLVCANCHSIRTYNRTSSHG